MTKRVDVAAGVITRTDGRFLLGQRAPGTFYAGYWEFPGGKVEPGESPADALIRELDEELGIRVRKVRPWLTREHVYEHAHVRLHFFDVAEWEGELQDHVHSALSWERSDAQGVGPMLPANGPILKSLRLPRWMGITHAAEIGVARQLSQIDDALKQDLKLIQVREPSMSAADLTAFAGEVVRVARPHGALVMVNGDADIACEVGADGVHLPAAQLRTLSVRPECDWVGASCHTRAELECAAARGLDYAVLGAVFPTATHPGQATLGWGGFGELVRGLPMPVFALGGLARADMDDARDAGAHGVAAIRGSWIQS
ncbi:Nudix family hydrolase [Aromatoleum diolicum]|uniref:8-oxo-dGTP diphosphatase n=1 Tax=Aromatoleum diolicum TaxID=75796 RepID=A0ABX1Q8V8_9RHOO|nr:Nudix family hydrolase [Aromatoleum diolicum]NMG73570.1 Nudix family hydrolase [Aromatoleum diolicum]